MGPKVCPWFSPGECGFWDLAKAADLKGLAYQRLIVDGLETSGNGERSCDQILDRQF